MRKILFLCIANSARSQMAEGLAKALFAYKNDSAVETLKKFRKMRDEIKEKIKNAS